MISRDFIINSINQISKNFSFLKYTYYRDEMSDAHFIQITPSEYFESFEEKFVKYQNDIVLAFIEKYPYESLAFIGEEDLFEGESPVFVFCGENISSNNVEISWFGNEVENLFEDYEADVKTVATIFNKGSRVKVKHQQISSGFEFNFKEISVNEHPQDLNTNIEKTSIINQVDPAYEMDYFSLAA